VILLTVLLKTRSSKTAEVARALHVQKIREAETAPLTRCSAGRWTDMTARRTSYEELAAGHRDSDEYCAGYAEVRRAFLIGQAVRERRLALGLSQVELAARADMTQPALSRLEAGGVVPTIPLLERISAALDADLILEIAPRAA
jgi:DNA-binding XRE family transcriptional regulator